MCSFVNSNAHLPPKTIFGFSGRMSLSAEVSVGSLRMERKIRAAKEEDHLFTDCNWVFVIYGNKLDSAYRLLQHIKFRSTD